MQNNRVVVVLLRCVIIKDNTEQSLVKFCLTVDSALMANIQVTNIGKCSVGFRG